MCWAGSSRGRGGGAHGSQWEGMCGVDAVVGGFGDGRGERVRAYIVHAASEESGLAETPQRFNVLWMGVEERVMEKDGQ